MFRKITVLPVLLLSSAVFAQNPPPQRPVAPAPATPAPIVAQPNAPKPVVTPQPVPNPQPPSLSTTISTAERPVRLQFPNTDVKDVLAFYEKLAGVRLVYDNQVVGPVNIVINEDIPRDEAKLIIEINLLLNGFTLVPVENSKIVKVIGIGKSPRTAGIPIVADELLIPDGEHVVTYLARLKFADPQEVTQVLGTFVVQSPGQYTNITPLPKSSAILITENSAILRGLLKVIHEMDIPPAEVVSEFIALERADAEDVQKKLLEIFNKTPQPGAAAAPGGARPAPRAGQPATLPDGTPVPSGITAEQTGQGTIEITGGKLSEDSIIVGKITLTADKRTNRLHVVTRPSNIKFVRKLVKEFDENVMYGEPSIRKLKFVLAEDIFDVVVKAISDPGAKEDTATGAAATGAGGQRTTGQTGGQQSNLFGNRGGTGGSGGAGGSGGSQSLSESLNAPERAIKPNAVTVGNSKIIADNRANSIIVLGNQEVKDKLFKVIDELDVRAPQVLLHTVIGQLTLSEAEQFGVNYFIRKANALGQNPGVPISTTPGTVTTDPTTGATTGTTASTNNTSGLVNLADIVSAPSGAPVLNLNNLLTSRNWQTAIVAGGTGLSGFIAAGNTLDAIVTALQSTNRFRVTARPSLFTNNNKKAIIASGEEIAIPTTIQSGFGAGTTGTGTNNLVTNSQIQFKTVALSLEILPFINADREVVLDIVQKFDEQVGTTRIDNNDIPRIATRVLQSNVSVPNEATLVLGGLIKQNNSKTISGIPYLSKIPYLGALFRTTTTDKRREELVILIRPVVTYGPGESVQTRERAQEFLNIPPDLESTIYPDGKKGSTTAEKMLRKPVVPLRDGITPAPQPKIQRR